MQYQESSIAKIQDIFGSSCVTYHQFNKLKNNRRPLHYARNLLILNHAKFTGLGTPNKIYCPAFLSSSEEDLPKGVDKMVYILRDSG